MSECGTIVTRRAALQEGGKEVPMNPALIRARKDLLNALSAFVDESPHTAPPQPDVQAAMSLYHQIQVDQT